MDEKPAGPNLPWPIALLIPQERIIITQILVYLNLAVFIYMIANGVGFLQPDPQDLIRWGSNYGPQTLGAAFPGEWWRTASCMFIHIGAIHILFNMYALLSIGAVLEPMVGKVRFIVAYFFSGICAGLASVLVNPLVNSAGASGSIFGLLGLLLVIVFLNPRHIDERVKKALLTNIVVIIAINLGMGLLPGIDNAAHIGGLLSGALMGLLLYPSFRRPESFGFQLANVAAAALVFSAALFLAYQAAPRGAVRFESVVRDIAVREEKAQSIYYDVVSNFTAVKSNYYIGRVREAVAIWDTNIALLSNLGPLPGFISARTALLTEYCVLQKKFYQTMLRDVSGEKVRKEDYESLNASISSVIGRITNEKR